MISRAVKQAVKQEHELSDRGEVSQFFGSPFYPDFEPPPPKNSNH